MVIRGHQGAPRGRRRHQWSSVVIKVVIKEHLEGDGAQCPQVHRRAQIARLDQIRKRSAQFGRLVSDELGRLVTSAWYHAFT